MKKIGLFLIILMLLSLGLIGMAGADDGGYEYKGSWAGIAPELDKQLNKPQGVAVDCTNNCVYVADTENHRVRKFTTTGTRTMEWGCQGTQTGQFKSPEGIAVSADGCFVYVADTANHRIQKFSSSGVFVLSWGGQGTADGKFGSPTGICVDTLGCVYVADTENNRVQKFSNAGVFVTKWTGETPKPEGVGIGTSGDIFVASKYSINRFPNTSGNPFSTGGWDLSSSQGIAVDSSGNVYIVDTAGNTVKKYTDTGTLIWTATSTTFGSPSGIAVNGSYVYIADTNNSQIQRLTIEGGTCTDKWGSSGSSTGILNFAQAMAMDANGNIFVADTLNHCIQKFDQLAGTFTLKWGGFGSSTGMFNSPQGIAIDKTHGWIYISDTGNKRIQKFDLAGNFIKSWTNSLQSSQGIVVDSSGNVYVVDAGIGAAGFPKVEKFDSDGNYL
ncbi:SMP-30/gluconolactonase/LRE family protein, partial [bacterium]|nr:SMP-30/gluconolactonase/LRE family protein [bacterium]